MLSKTIRAGWGQPTARANAQMRVFAGRFGGKPPPNLAQVLSKKNLFWTGVQQRMSRSSVSDANCIGTISSERREPGFRRRGMGLLYHVRRKLLLRRPQVKGRQGTSFRVNQTWQISQRETRKNCTTLVQPPKPAEDDDEETAMSIGVCVCEGDLPVQGQNPGGRPDQHARHHHGRQSQRRSPFELPQPLNPVHRFRFLFLQTNSPPNRRFKGRARLHLPPLFQQGGQFIFVAIHQWLYAAAAQNARGSFLGGRPCA